MRKQNRKVPGSSFNVGGSGKVPHGGDKNVGQEGVQGSPGMQLVDRVPRATKPNRAALKDENVSIAHAYPADANQFDQNGHKK